MRTLFKKLGFIPLSLLYLIVSALVRLLPADKKKKRAASIRTTSRFARILLALLGVHVHVKHRERLHKTGRVRLVVSNHLSYLDILIISSLMPSVFITSVELKHTALLGTLARLSGSLFVERRKVSGLKQELGQIAHVLGQGAPVVLFPEGTTSNGDRVQPFKNSLFDSAVMAQADLVPICLRYTRVNNERLTPENRDLVFYYGGAAFLKHFLRLLYLRSIDVEVVLLDPIRVDGHASRKALASQAHKGISTAYLD